MLQYLILVYANVPRTILGKMGPGVPAVITVLSYSAVVVMMIQVIGMMIVPNVNRVTYIGQCQSQKAD